MGFFVWKKIKVSKGFSTGVKGARVSVGPRGIYLYGAKGPLRHRKALMSTSKKDVREKQYTVDGQPGSSVATLDESLYINRGKGAFLFFFVLFVGVVIASLFISWQLSVGILVLGIIALHFYLSAPKQKAVVSMIAGLEKIKKGNCDGAIMDIKDSLEKDPSNINGLKLLASAYFETGKYQETCGALNKYKENVTEENDYDLELMLAEACYRNGKFNDAIEILQKIPKDHDNKEHVIVMLAWCFQSQKMPDMALEIIKSYISSKRKMNEERAEMRYILGNIYFSKGDKAKALKEWKKVFSYDVGYRDIKDKIYPGNEYDKEINEVSIGAELIKSQLVEYTQKPFIDVEGKTKLDRQVNRNLKGRELEKIGKIDDAIPLYEQNLLEKFDGSHPYSRLAIIYKKKGLVDDEIRVVGKALKILKDPKNQHSFGKRLVTAVNRKQEDKNN